MSEEQIRSLMQHDRETGERAIYDAYYTYVYAIVYRRISGIGTREDVEDCVIDVFLEVFRHFDMIHESSLNAYIGTAAKNKASNLCRRLTSRSRRTEPLEQSDTEYASEQDVEHEIEQSELTDRLLACIAQLGEPDASGRRSPVPIEGSEFEIPTEVVIM